MNATYIPILIHIYSQTQTGKRQLFSQPNNQPAEASAHRLCCQLTHQPTNRCSNHLCLHATILFNSSFHFILFHFFLRLFYNGELLVCRCRTIVLLYNKCVYMCVCLVPLHLCLSACICYAIGLSLAKNQR